MRKISNAVSAAIRKWTGRWFDEDNQRLVWCFFYVCYSALLILLGSLMFMILIDIMEDYSK